MIGKLIEARKLPGGARRYAQALAAYLAAARSTALSKLKREFGVDPCDFGQRDATMALDIADYVGGAKAKPEKVRYKAALIKGVDCDWGGGFDEAMLRVSLLKPGKAIGVRHVVFSFREESGPDEVQAAEIFRVLAREAGCEEAVILYSHHQDTRRPHLHAAIITLDANGHPLGFGAIDDEPDAHSGRQAILAVHRTIAWAEHLQGWESEANSVFKVSNDMLIRREQGQSDELKRQGKYARQKEEETGFWSLERIGREKVLPILKTKDATWQQVHEDLGRLGLRIAPEGHGGLLWAGDRRIKLSTIDRSISWKRLQDGPLGTYVSAEQNIVVEPFRPWVADLPRAERYLALKNQEDIAKRQINVAARQLRNDRDLALRELETEADVGRGNRVSARAGKALARHLSAKTKEAVRSGFSDRIAALLALKRELALSLATIEPGDIDFSSIGTTTLCLTPQSALRWTPGDRVIPQKIDGFEAEESQGRVDYYLDAQRVRRPAISDCGSIIWMNTDDDRAIRAALLIAAERWPSVAAFGTPAAVARITRVADMMGIEIEAASQGRLKPSRPSKRLPRHRKISLPQCPLVPFSDKAIQPVLAHQPMATTAKEASVALKASPEMTDQMKAAPAVRTARMPTDQSRGLER